MSVDDPAAKRQLPFGPVVSNHMMWRKCNLVLCGVLGIYSCAIPCGWKIIMCCVMSCGDTFALCDEVW